MSLYPNPSTYQNNPQQQQQQQQFQHHQHHQGNTINVIKQQPMGGGDGSYQPQNIREWSSGICGCCEDVSGCCYCFFCFYCFGCSLASKMDECVMGPFCFGEMFLLSMRTKLRAQYGVKGSILNDCCCMACCTRLAAHQMYRELKVLP